MEQNQAATPETTQQLVRFRLTTPKGEPVLEVSSAGAFYWNPQAPQLIADNDQWPAEFTGIRFVLQALWNIEIEPMDAMEMFNGLNVAIPSDLQAGTPEFDTELKFAIFKKGISYGRRYLLELSGEEFQKLAPTFGTLLNSIGAIAYATGAKQDVSDDAWKQLDELLKEGHQLLPTLHRIGRDCQHVVVPVPDEEGTHVVNVACVKCHAYFPVWQPPASDAPEATLQPGPSVGQGVSIKEAVVAATPTTLVHPSEPVAPNQH